MSYPPPILGRPAGGIPSLFGPFDIRNDRYRTSGYPAWWGSPQPGPKRRRLLTQAPRLAALAGCSCPILQYDINLAGGMNTPSTSANMAGRRDSTGLQSLLPRKSTFLWRGLRKQAWMDKRDSRKWKKSMFRVKFNTCCVQNSLNVYSFYCILLSLPL